MRQSDGLGRRHRVSVTIKSCATDAADISMIGLGRTPNKIVRTTSGPRTMISRKFKSADIREFWVIQRSEYDMTVQPQGICRGDDNASRPQGRNHDIDLERSEQCQKFTDKADCARQTHIRHGEDHERGGVKRHPVDQTRHRRRSRACACGRKPRRRRGTARPRRCRGKSSGNSAGNTLRGGGKYAHRHHPHMGNGRISDQLFHILLHDRDNGGVDDGDDRNV